MNGAPSSSAGQDKPLLIASWNVAGWEATLRYIKEHYKTLDCFFERHGFDILCLQEVKVTRQKLSAHNAASLGAHSVSGWESFWSCSPKGFNGVTTFARKGLTRHADAAPLGKPVDAEGRCVMTDHGAVVIFNVYVHATGSDTDGSRRAKKLEFLEAVRAKMRAVRAGGRAVCLAGDLNIARRAADGPWQQAFLSRASLRAHGRVELVEGDGEVAGWGDEVSRLRTELGRAFHRRGEGGAAGGYEWCAALEAVLDRAALRDSAVGEALRRVVLSLGESSSSQEAVAWLRSIEADGMVDTFGELRPAAECRFTCWDQYKNMRHVNVGRRIDYIYLDRPLFDEAALRGPPLAEAEDAAGALRAATAGGRWAPAPWTGASVLQEAPMTTHDTQFVPPHSGVIYTPPQASDHVAVSLLLRHGAVPAQTLQLDDDTRSCSFRPQRTIASFFGAAPAAKAARRE
ncbi:hypothetical protein EMIHUDRAFT_200012 [Emiliania huxleyi CCMP1516]|uniref:Endonuclease/exonuclease/phosphatase domain-containing protein n=4 Tax=Emiliania huxleyi TaxID=2903 RepID=A0A0D3KUT6_EMIH1|nr:hypothetical protein EMIHUDRAFT_200012 [Emiliania huxleyi CCMP1516]EOD39521.1 hypothetical protein EMIHUDRAFT_200012 [Emiliania huxleyi CCMP1516]|eukprot:XP_005791950.1 hypothetical protein EMIHUDRAFT_200012 [Emiliania huxleyi CCMP1516]